MITLKNLYIKCREILAKAEIETPDFEALCLVENVTGYNRLGIMTHSDEPVSPENEQKLFSMTERRTKKEPLQYILGKWNFCGFDFYVGEGVLIPRDDTEVVVNLCTEFIKNRQSRKTIDLCAGSGAISVALSKLANADVTAVELSDTAFCYLEKNIKLNNSPVRAYKGDIFKCHTDFADGDYDLIVSNPPYIKSDDIKTLQAEVQQEPSMALDGGKSGFDFYESIIENWSNKIKIGGALALELGEEQAEYVASLMKAKGFENIRTELDLGGTQRAIIGTMG